MSSLRPSFHAHVARSLKRRRCGLKENPGRSMASVTPQVPAGWDHMQTGDAYWKRIPLWSEIDAKDFISYAWQSNNSVRSVNQLSDFATMLLPQHLPPKRELELSLQSERAQKIPRTATELVKDLRAGIERAPMAIKLTPHVLSAINWSDPLNDPLFRQFIPLASRAQPDHPKLSLDSLDETADSPVRGFIHRYPDKGVFLASSVCPVYCRFCTRSYAVGTDTNIVNKTRFLPILKRWEPMFDYIQRTPTLADILVSGGDSYTLSPEQLQAIGERLLDIPHIMRVRVATKGLAICPSRLIDKDDKWADALIQLSHRGRRMGKSVALHTHFNHPNEVSWITRIAAQRFFEEGVVVRNQTVLLNGVNDQVNTMKSLIKLLSSMNIQPYYVFQSDMVPGIEDLRTPLHVILAMESQIRGSTAGFMTPNFVVHLAGGGGKRLACSYDSYDRKTGLSTFLAPGSKDPDRKWEHWDPLFSLPSQTV